MVSTNGQSSEARARGRYGQRRNSFRPDATAAPAGREMPWNEQAEAHVLGCCLLEGDAVEPRADCYRRAKRAGVGAESFFSGAHRACWEAMGAVVEREGVVTVAMLVEELREQKLLDSVGIVLVMGLTDKLPTTAHFGFFLEKVIEKASMRKALAAAQAIIEGIHGYSGGGLDAYAPLRQNLEALQAVTSASRGELPPILKWDEFMPAVQSKLPDELVEGLLHRGAKMMVAGGSKSFKTWILLHLGLSVAAGVPWWGMKVRQGRVLYVNMELMRGFCEGRVRSIKAAMKVDAVPGFDSWHLRGYARDFKELMPQFLSALAGGQYALLILDPVYKLLGERDENANGEVAQLLNEFEAVAVRGNCAVAYGHHHSKGNQSEKDAKDRSSGAGAWTRDPDALVDLVPHEEEEHFTATFTLRNNAPKKAMVVRWEFPVMSIAPGMDPTALRKAGRPKERGVADIVTLLMGHEPGLGYGEWEKAAAARGISESTFKRLRTQAVSDGKVELVAGLYRLKAKG